MPEDEAIKGQTFTEPYRPTEELRVPKLITIEQPVFKLTETDWAYLKHAQPWSFTVGKTVLIAFLIYTLVLIAKLIARVVNPTDSTIVILIWEWYVPVFLLAVALGAFSIGGFCKNPSKRVKSEIEAFFENTRSPR